ncbi:uncharacterized protein LOC128548605 isoform X2 [Mercenaria mercenaria]|uniref:uncharacterized protein LOC128548605 isoform X2 n=1 Tax=Mercenaria mercenaria TaxID=6596 RepID=UPI00234F8B4D|nr:uncharacterized protein LOC128548605 isoform X2 [Mercenaria mercenaria]
MGVIIALLVVVVISLIVSKFVVWKRQSAQRSREDTDISFKHATSPTNTEHKRDERMPTELHAVYYNVMEENGDSCSADNSTASEYEKIESIQVPEHEYGHISSAD